MYKRIIAALAIAGMAAFAMAAVAALAGARINTSPSIPLGLYWAVDAPLKLGEYVQVCPPAFWRIRCRAHARLHRRRPLRRWLWVSDEARGCAER